MGSAPAADPGVGVSRTAPPAAAEGNAAAPLLVIDTNIVLDLFLFADPAWDSLRAALEAAAIGWIATAAMREELVRVLAYPHLMAQGQRRGRGAGEVLACFDRLVQVADPAPRAPMRCRDPDDQKFVDLAFARRADLLSKDLLVLRLRSRLGAHGVAVSARFEAPPPTGTGAAEAGVACGRLAASGAPMPLA